MLVRMMCGVVAGGLLLGSCSTGETPELSSGGVVFERLVEVRRVRDAAVMSVTSTGSVVDPGQNGGVPTVGSGAAFMVDPSGLAVTSAHVVAGAASVEVRFGGADRRVEATVLGASECLGVAVLQLPQQAEFSYPVVEWSQDVVTSGSRVDVVAFDDGGAFEFVGAVVGDALADGSTAHVSVPALVGLDVPSVASSGGAVFNLRGEVVAVAIPDVSGEGRAIPTWVVERVVPRLARGEDLDSVGLNVVAVGEGVWGEAGVWVRSVRSGSIADRVGLVPGDVIVAMGGSRLASDGTLADYCQAIRSTTGDPTPVRIVRDGEPLEVSFDMSTAVSSDQPPAPLPTRRSLDEFERVTDDTGVLSVDMPVEWEARVTSPVMVDGVSIPRVSASRAEGALTDFWGTRYRTAAISVYSFPPATPMRETVAGLVAGSWWSTECTPSEPGDLDEAGYVGEFWWADCPEGPFAMMMTFRRQESDRWILAVIAPAKSADYSALDWALASAGLPPGVKTTPPAEPAAQPLWPEGEPTGPEVFDEDLDAANEVLREIGVPPRSGFISTRFVDLDSSSYLFSTDASRDELLMWLFAVPDRIGCEQANRRLPFLETNRDGATLMCTLKRDGHDLLVYVDVPPWPGEPVEMGVSDPDD